MRINSLHLVILATAFLSCSSDKTNGGGTGNIGGAANPGAGAPSGGNANPSAGASTGGSSTTGGSAPTAGSNATGGTSTGGALGTGGSSGTGTGPGGASTGGAGGALTGITVKLDAVHQTIQGFGINDALSKSGAAFSTTVLDNLFTTTGTDAIGLSILRIGMSSTGGLNGTPQSDIDGAKTRGAKIIGSCWSPTADCKSNGSTQDGGSVKKECYDSWSDTITAFAVKYGLYAMSIGNEPDFASCGDAEPCNGHYDTTTFTANQMVDFVQVAGPKLQAKNIKVIAPEASEWIHIWSNESARAQSPATRTAPIRSSAASPPATRSAPRVMATTTATS